jgi:hypothetical protein
MEMKRNTNFDYGFARTRDIAFDAVMRLWDRRKAEGLTKAQLARNIGRDPAWVSRYLRGPGNWTLKTVGAFVVGLNGEVEINAHGLEDPIHPITNYDAYMEYILGDEMSARMPNPHSRPQPTKAEPSAGSELPEFLRERIQTASMALS